MQLKRGDLIKYGTILLILFFVLGFFWPLLYSPQQQEPEATPSPQAQAFLGRAIANATINGFGLKLFVQCSPGADVIGRINNISGIAGVLAIKRDLYLVDIMLSRSQNETTEDVRGVLENSCIGNFTLYREANLKFQQSVLFASEDGSKTMEISARDLENIVGYVDPRLQPGSAIQVILEADFLADGTVTAPSVVQVASEQNNTAANETNSTLPAASPSATNAGNSS